MKDYIKYNAGLKFFPKALKSREYSGGFRGELFQSTTISSNPESIENFLNHSCEPNGYINFEDLTFRALRNIKKGEELTFNYLTTEWDMANKFDCKCDSKDCFGYIGGFKYLPLKEKTKLLPFLSPFLKNKLILERKRFDA